MKYKEVWDLAIPFLKKAIKKDFVLHTKYVVKAMEILLETVNEDESLLIPAAILHDVGWAKVPHELQLNYTKENHNKALELHLEYAIEIIPLILDKLDYDQDKINKIIEIVKAHKFTDPLELDKQLLIDADNLSEVFKEPFYEDVKIYNKTPNEMYNIRKDNKFYTITAEKMFNLEIERRKSEL